MYYFVFVFVVFFLSLIDYCANDDGLFDNSLCVIRRI